MLTKEQKIVPGGLYVTFEGPEGCGKTSQIRLLHDRLAAEGYGVLSTKEPGGTPIGLEIRKRLLNSEYTWSASQESILFWADRIIHHTEFVKPALEQGIIVLGDRDFHSSIAYQAYGRGLPLDEMAVVHRWAIGEFKPHAVFLYDGPVEKLLERKARQNAKSGSHELRFDNEKIDFHRRVRNGFLELATNDKKLFHQFDALQSIEALHEKTYAAMHTIIKEHV